MEQYLNNAGAGLLSSDSFEVISNYLQLERKVGAYKAASDSKNKMEQFYTNAATVINASSPYEIAFIDSASRGLNMAIYGSGLKAGDTIITLSTEFGTNLITVFDYAQKIGANVQVVKCDIMGNFSMTEIEEGLIKGARLVVISHAAAHASIVNPVKEIGALCKRYGAIYIIDGCQSVGQIHVDVNDLQCDAYITTGRKWLCGPRGTGFLYIRSSSQFHTTQLDLSSADLILDDQYNVLGVKVRDDARQFELWERSIAGMLGFSNAIANYISQDQAIISNRICKLSNYIRKEVTQNKNINLIGDVDSTSGIIGFYLNDVTREGFVRELFEKGSIGISTMSDWDCPLHFPRNGAKLIFRLSPHYYTDDSTVSKACEILSLI